MDTARPIIISIFCAFSCFVCGTAMKTTIVKVEQSPGNGYDLFPEQYKVWFSHNGAPVYYDLVRDDAVTNFFTPEIAESTPYMPEDLMNENNRHEFAFYHNGQEVGSPERSQFILHRTDMAVPAKVYGQLKKDGNRYTIMATGENNEHAVQHDYALQIDNRNRVKRSSVTYEIEIAVWIAPDLFRYQKSRLGLTSSQTRAWLNTFSQSLIRDVNELYKTITTVSVGLVYQGRGEDTSLAVPWYADNLDTYLIISDTVSDLSTYLTIVTAAGTLNDHDHAVVLTRADLANNAAGGGAAIRIASGSNTICSGAMGSSVGIAEVNNHDYIRAVGQAIAYGFSGTGIVSDDYTMMVRLTYSFPIPTSNQADLWSVDSSNQASISSGISGLGTACLSNIVGPNTYEDLISSTALGQRFTYSEQCQYIYGSNADICGGQSDTTENCYRQVQCSISGVCGSDYILPADKTTCDTGLGCRYAVCDYNVDTTTTSTTSTTSTTTPTTTTPTSPTTTVKTTTTTAVERASTTPTPNPNLSSSAPIDCCCERRPLGQVKINIQYIPCPELEPADDMSYNNYN